MSSILQANGVLKTNAILKTMAHRGVSNQAPENTLAAFILAVDAGCQWIEIDVQLSSDGVPMVIHDDTVNRCTNGCGKVAEMTLSQLKKLDAGLWFNDKYRGEPIPTLLETLDFVQRTQTKLNIELKVYPQDDIALLCAKVAQVIIASGIAADQILFSSFHTQALIEMQDLLPQVRRGQLWQKIPREAFDILREIKAYSVHCDYRFLNSTIAQQIKQFDYQLYCYTPNLPELVDDYWHWGVDMMITDIPQAYAALENV
ncbi:glycerophosphoryl diester phosphodiesterase [Vibrio halioticoli NBRC 102217]|uniref:Glycerophosphoryl diester phosphodiesterase n=1 Tax=Vibrio halioticoli NBRC 102217 TaxID=1219072 RepID=V5FHI5_9VIBR|nr:glycerophosphoryl diester phosphodiesterase [Vibrio halioticoli]GAD88462.1 glycerophosphoryl diester phosphodiesterase [Vibrio halioticoli NBRC 102217]